jgi:hypothetical protein
VDLRLGNAKLVGQDWRRNLAANKCQNVGRNPDFSAHDAFSKLGALSADDHRYRAWEQRTAFWRRLQQQIRR